MKSLWNKLSAREQALMTGAVGLLVILILALVVIRPVIFFKSEAEQNLIAAQSEYRAIAGLAKMREGMSRTSGEGQAEQRSSDQSPRIIISTSARDMGIIVSRIQPAETGSLTLWMDSVTSPLFYGWLKTLEVDYGITPEIVSLQKNGDASLRAQVQFEGVQ